MAVSLPHGFGLVPHKLVNDTLVHAQSRKVGSKAVPVTMKTDLEPVVTAAQIPLGFPHGLPEQAVGLVLLDRLECFRVTDHELPLGAFCSPLQQMFFDFGMHVDTADRLRLGPGLFSATSRDISPAEIHIEP